MKRLVVIAKECVPGRVKTRLTTLFTPQQAAAIAHASLVQTLESVRAVHVADRVLLFDGDPQGLNLEGFRVVPQVPGTLDQRIATAFDDAPDPTLLIGMDTPQVSPTLLQTVVDDDRADSWIGLAVDGGFWALGLRHPNGALVRGVSMSTSSTGRTQLARLQQAGLRTVRLPILRDVDTPLDASVVASLVPGSSFAEALELAWPQVRSNDTARSWPVRPPELEHAPSP